MSMAQEGLKDDHGAEQGRMVIQVMAQVGFWNGMVVMIVLVFDHPTFQF